MLIKIAEAPITNIKQASLDQDDPEILQYFKKTAAELKAIAPKAKDFLYFTCVMMHAAEHALLDENGAIRKTADGKDVEAHWEITKDGSWIWNCTDPNIKPYKNHNSDIFPRSELKKAYKNWVAKPLCLDHQSQSVDMVRGVIIDTVYDDKKDRIIALCALDKKNYGDLADKVASGVAACVSMGVGVAKAICTEKGCHRVARFESEFCNHMKLKSGYGEINVDLSPIELSIVVNGADPKAKIRRVIASANKIINDNSTDESIKNDLEKIIKELENLDSNNISYKTEAPYGQNGRSGREISEIPDHDTPEGNIPQAANTARFADVRDILTRLQEKIAELDIYKTKEDTVMANNKKEAFFQGGGGVNEPTPGQTKYPKEEADKIRDTEDRHMTNVDDMGPVDGMHPGYESFGESETERKRRLQRLAEKEARQLRRKEAMEKAKDAIKNKREAYYNGTEEPKPGKPQYPKEDSDKIRDKEDKQMVGESPFPGVGKIDGLYGDDEKAKKMLSRAKLNARFVKAANPDGSDNLSACRWDVYAKDDSGSRLILSATVKDLAGNRVNTLYNAIATKEYGSKIIQTIKEAGLITANKIFKGAQDTVGNFVIVDGANPTGRPLTGEEWAEFSESGGYAPYRLMSGAVVQDARKVNFDSTLGKQAQENPDWMRDSDADKLRQQEVMRSYVVKGPQDKGYRAPTAVEVQMFINNDMKDPFGYSFRPVRKAQAPAPAMPGGQPGATPEVPAAAPVPVEEDMEYTGEDGNPVDKLEDSVREIDNLVADMQKGLDALKEEKGELDETNVAPVAGGMPVAAMRKKLNSALIKGFEKAISEANDVREELDMIRHVASLDKRSRVVIAGLYPDTQKDVKKVIANIYTMLESFVSYANSNELLSKRGENVLQPPVQNPEKLLPEKLPSTLPKPEKMPVNPGDANQSTDSSDPLASLLSPDNYMAADDEDEEDEDKEEKEEKEEKEDKKSKKSKKEDKDEEDENDLDYSPENKSISGNPDEIASMLKQMSRKDRDALRLKLAQKGVKFIEELKKAHPGGGFTTELDTKPTGDLAKIETLEETHNKMLEVATKSVKQAAEKIQKYIVAGQITPEDLPGLIAKGIDPAAVAYWKKFWGEAKDQESSKFVGELVKQYNSKKATEANEQLRVKMAKAYELAYSMAERGLISRNPTSLHEQVNKILDHNDEQYNHLAEMVGRIPVKTASSMAAVGSQDEILSFNPPRATDSGKSLVDEFTEAFNSVPRNKH